MSFDGKLCQGNIVCLVCALRQGFAEHPGPSETAICCEHCTDVVVEYCRTANDFVVIRFVNDRTPSCKACGHKSTFHFGVQCNECKSTLGGAKGPHPRFSVIRKRLTEMHMGDIGKNSQKWKELSPEERDSWLCQYLASFRNDATESTLDKDDAQSSVNVENHLNQMQYWMEKNIGKSSQKVETNELRNDDTVLAPVSKWVLQEVGAKMKSMEAFNFVFSSQSQSVPSLLQINVENVLQKFFDDGDRSVILDHILKPTMKTRFCKLFEDSEEPWRFIEAELRDAGGDEPSAFNLSNETWQSVSVCDRTLVVNKKWVISSGIQALASYIKSISMAPQALPLSVNAFESRLAEILNIYQNKLSSLFSEDLSLVNHLEMLVLRKGRLLGQGKYGKVYVVNNGQLRLALKEINLNNALSHFPKLALAYSEACGYGCNSGDSWFGFSHSAGVCPLSCWIDADSQHLFVLTPYYGQDTLLEFVKKQYSNAHPDTTDALFLQKRIIFGYIVWQICYQLSIMHDNGLAHCDLHANNVLVDDDASAALIDFGLSRSLYPQGGEHNTTECDTSGSSTCGTSTDNYNKVNDVWRLARVYQYMLNQLAPDFEYTEEQNFIRKWESCRRDNAEAAKTACVELLDEVVRKLADVLLNFEGGRKYIDELPLGVRMRLPTTEVCHAVCRGFNAFC